MNGQHPAASRDERTKTMLVSIEGHQGEPDALELLCRAMNPAAVRFRFAYALIVPAGVPLYVAMPAAEDHGIRALKQAQEVARRYGIGSETALVRGRTAAECIAEEGEREDVAAVWILYHDNPALWGHRLITETLTAILDGLSCPVMIVHLPHPRRTKHAAADLASMYAAAAAVQPSLSGGT